MMLNILSPRNDLDSVLFKCVKINATFDNAEAADAQCLTELVLVDTRLASAIAWSAWVELASDSDSWPTHFSSVNGLLWDSQARVRHARVGTSQLPSHWTRLYFGVLDGCVPSCRAIARLHLAWLLQAVDTAKGLFDHNWALAAFTLDSLVVIKANTRLLLWPLDLLLDACRA